MAETEKTLQFVIKELGITYQEKGRNIFFSCPFHNDKTPSLCFSKENKFFKCFSCGFKAKDILTFWAKIKKVSFNEAVAKFTELGYVDSIISKTRKQEEKETATEKIFKLVGEIYQYNLSTEEGSKQLSYLRKKRRLDDEMIRQFALGTSIFNIQISKLLFESKLFTVSDLVDSGLLHITDKNEPFDFFWAEQIIFPISNEKGQLVSFASRNLNETRDGKYFFLPTTKSTSKSSLIYNYDKVRETSTDFCYLVEGFFDVISLTRMGFSNSLSTLGTSISLEQIKLLKKLEKKVIIFFDGDQAGVEAAVKASVFLILNDIDCEIIECQGKMDPDDLCLQGEIEISKAVRRRRSPILFTIRYYFKNMRIEENPQKTKAFVLKIADLFSQFRRNVQFFIVKKISVITGMTLEETKEIYFWNSKQKFEVKDLVNDSNSLDLLEQSIIYYSCRDRDFWLAVKNYHSNFLTEKNWNLWKIVSNFYIEKPNADNFNGFEKREEFLNLPLFDEKEEKKLITLQLFTRKKIN